MTGIGRACGPAPACVPPRTVPLVVVAVLGGGVPGVVVADGEEPRARPRQPRQAVEGGRGLVAGPEQSEVAAEQEDRVELADVAGGEEGADAGGEALRVGDGDRARRRVDAEGVVAAAGDRP